VRDQKNKAAAEKKKLEEEVSQTAGQTEEL